MNSLHFDMVALLSNSQSSIIHWFYFFYSCRFSFQHGCSASNRFVLLLYCLPPSHNFIFITDLKFLIGFRSGLDAVHSIIFSKSFMLKEFTCKFWYRRRSIVVHKYTLNFETMRLGFVLCKKSFDKIIIFSTIQFKSFIDFEWSDNGLVENSTLPPPCCLLLATGMSEQDKVHPLAHSSCPSNITWDSSLKIHLEKSISVYF